MLTVILSQNLCTTEYKPELGFLHLSTLSPTYNSFALLLYRVSLTTSKLCLGLIVVKDSECSLKRSRKVKQTNGK